MNSLRIGPYAPIGSSYSIQWTSMSSERRSFSYSSWLRTSASRSILLEYRRRKNLGCFSQRSHLVFRRPRERDIAQAADAVRAPAPAPLHLVLVEMTEAVELIHVR